MRRSTVLSLHLQLVFPVGAKASTVQALLLSLAPGNTKGGSITVLLASCLTGLESAV